MRIPLIQIQVAHSGGPLHVHWFIVVPLLLGLEEDREQNAWWVAAFMYHHKHQLYRQSSLESVIVKC